jgi:hypothetical protein
MMKSLLLKCTAKAVRVFSEGRNSWSVIAGTNRRDVNLVSKWAVVQNELRMPAFGVSGCSRHWKVLFALSFPVPSFVVAVMADP